MAQTSVTAMVYVCNQCSRSIATFDSNVPPTVCPYCCSDQMEWSHEATLINSYTGSIIGEAVMNNDGSKSGNHRYQTTLDEAGGYTADMFRMAMSIRRKMSVTDGV